MHGFTSVKNSPKSVRINQGVSPAFCYYEYSFSLKHVHASHACHAVCRTSVNNTTEIHGVIHCVVRAMGHARRHAAVHFVTLCGMQRGVFLECCMHDGISICRACCPAFHTKFTLVLHAFGHAARLAVRHVNVTLVWTGYYNSLCSHVEKKVKALMIFKRCRHNTVTARPLHHWQTTGMCTVPARYNHLKGLFKALSQLLPHNFQWVSLCNWVEVNFKVLLNIQNTCLFLKLLS